MLLKGESFPLQRCLLFSLMFLFSNNTRVFYSFKFVLYYSTLSDTRFLGEKVVI